ncbi:DNA polymerase [Nocardia sp. CA-128927]|uniref:DNA polymerase n=1 Tax=Nocardia sp. CA-128927 TaxID=3239975 RepID=UPI003D989053
MTDTERAPVVAGLCVLDTDHPGREHLTSLRQYYTAQAQDCADAAYEVLGRPLDLDSPQHLQIALFEELDLPLTTASSDQGYSTDSDALQELFAATRHPFLAHVLDRRHALHMCDQLTTRLTGALV